MKRGLHFDVVSNPEFLREGSAVNDYYHPPVTVIGSSNEKAIQITTELYKDLPAPIKIVSIEVAEFIKYVNNSWHALKITFANEVGNICKRLKIDSHEVMDLFVMDKQLNLSDYYLKPGFAYGGSCLPKDLKGLQTIAHDNYLKSPVLSSIERSNELQKRIAIEMIEKYNKKKLGIIGLSFKKGTDDLRYSPIVEVAEYFLGKGYSIKVYDKYINMSKLTGTNLDYINKQIPHLSGMITDNLNEVIQDAEIVVINHKISDIVPLIDKHKDVFFIDLVKVSERKHTNCEGICW
jgi:GDP-mannose 6-dehydrogenase